MNFNETKKKQQSACFYGNQYREGEPNAFSLIFYAHFFFVPDKMGVQLSKCYKLSDYRYLCAHHLY